MDIKKPTASPVRLASERLSSAMKERLNKQIKVELNASHLYRAAYAWCEFNGYNGASALFKKHTSEEMNHVDKLYEYLMDKNCMPITGAVPQQPVEFTNLKNVIMKAYEHEKYVTSTYEELGAFALKSKDLTTFTFVQWYLKEQVEEEALFLNILDTISMMEHEGVGIFEVDKFIGCLV